MFKRPKYRIIEFEGKYYPQRRIFYFFWDYVYGTIDNMGYGYPTLKEAEIKLDQFINPPPKPIKKVIKEYYENT